MDFKNTFGMDGKVVMVTGAASGIGKGIAEFFSEVGASVALLDINVERGEAVAKAIGGVSRFFLCNVVSNADCEKAVKAVEKNYGHIDVLVNCAGIIYRKNVLELQEEEWDKAIDIVLKGTFLLSKHAIPVMAQKRSGAIVNISSGWGVKGGPKAVSYCAAKGGLVLMTRAMAIDHGPQNIRVNCVCPGDTDTPLLRSEAEQLGLNMDKWLQESADRPIHRLGTPEDIAKAVYFLANDKLSPWITGAVLLVDGGGMA